MFWVTKEWLSYSLSLSAVQNNPQHNAHPKPYRQGAAEGNILCEVIPIHISLPQEAKPVFRALPTPSAHEFVIKHSATRQPHAAVTEQIQS